MASSECTACSSNAAGLSSGSSEASRLRRSVAWIVARSRNQPAPSAFAKIPHLVLAAGGVVIKVGDQVIGAIAVSGAPGGDNDALCAKSGLDKIRDRLK